MNRTRTRTRLAASLTAVAVLAGVGVVAVPLLASPAAAATGDAEARPNDAPVATSPLDVANPCDRTVVPPPGADGTTCMLPFPNNLFTTGTGTDRRLNLPLAGMPKGAAGKPINPAPYNVSDGFSPGQLIVIHVPGLDNRVAFLKTGSVPITDMARYADINAPIAVFDVQTGKRQPIFTEIDVNPLNPLPQSTAGGAAPSPARPLNTANVNLLIRSTKNFEYGHRYVVMMRNLKDATGAAIAPSPVFASYRDRGALTANDPRTERYEKDIFPVIESAGIARSSLYQAWDFSVASAPSVTSRLLSMRDDAFRQLGDTNLADRVVQGNAPAYTANAPTVDSEGIRTIQGTFTVPCYIDTANCAPGGQFVFDPRDTAQRTPLQLPGNVTTAKFTCKVPKRVYDSPTLEKVRPSLYGHGLLGGQGEVGQGQVKAMISEHGFMYCATDWEGFATGDLPTVAQALADMDRFPAVIDHTLQGELNFLYLARLMIHPKGLGANPAFQVTKDGVTSSFIDTTRAYYDGNSQGGIYGGTVMAVAPDMDRGVLGVPGINYSTLLQRSTDFATYAIPLYTAYPSEYERQLLLSVIQILWDRADPNGYQNTLAPGRQLPNTPGHVVMYQAGFGDHQVANVTADTAARSIGAAVDPMPFEDPDRSPDVNDVWGVPRIPSYPYQGSALVYFDIGPFNYVPGKGTPASPTENVAQQQGQDPHEAPRNTPCGRVMKNNFLRPDGVVTNPCGGAPYFAFDYKGKDGLPGQGDTVQPGDALPYTTPVPDTSPSPTASATMSASPTASPTTSVSASPTASPSTSATASSTSSPTSSPTATPPATSTLSGGFHALRPARVLDTRTDGGPIAAGADRLADVLGRGGVPTTGVTAVVVNATVTRPTTRMNLQIYPAGARPGRRTSNLNAVAGQTVANFSTVPIAADGRIALSVSAGSADVVLDVLGWYDDGSGPAGDGFVALTPQRRFDSRSSQPIAAGSDRDVTVLSPLPQGATAVVLNVTALGSTTNAYLQVYPTGNRPTNRTSTLNLLRGQTVANLAVVPVSSDGKISLLTSAGSMHVVIDLLGYYAAGSTRTFRAIGPNRSFDSRLQPPAVQAGVDREVTVLGVGGVPTSGVDAVLLNVTSTGATTPAYLQVYPTGDRPARPTSTLNVLAGQDVAAFVLAKVGSDGKISLSVSRGRMNVVFDVVGWVRSVG